MDFHVLLVRLQVLKENWPSHKIVTVKLADESDLEMGMRPGEHGRVCVPGVGLAQLVIFGDTQQCDVPLLALKLLLQRFGHVAGGGIQRPPVDVRAAAFRILPKAPCLGISCGPPPVRQCIHLLPQVQVTGSSPSHDKCVDHPAAFWIPRQRRIGKELVQTAYDVGARLFFFVIITKVTQVCLAIGISEFHFVGTVIGEYTKEHSIPFPLWQRGR
mmetsp:Transcript_36175/g.76035  ORF Transcript_36175/g.76035 Transcript_36175/m.76035 type:complete len:215 (-) Transcript_36175:99-743(-)